MNPELARQAKALASRSGQTFTQIVERAVAELISKDRTKSHKRKRIRLPVFGDPSRKMTWDEYQRLVAEAQFEDDMAMLRRTTHDAARR
jgi:hypothetical protein